MCSTISLGQQTGTGSFPTSFAPQPQFPFFAYDYGMCILDPRGSGFNVRGVVRLRQLRAGGPFGRFNVRALVAGDSGIRRSHIISHSLSYLLSFEKI